MNLPNGTELPGGNGTHGGGGPGGGCGAPLVPNTHTKAINSTVTHNFIFFISQILVLR